MYIKINLFILHHYLPTILTISLSLSLSLCFLKPDRFYLYNTLIKLRCLKSFSEKRGVEILTIGCHEIIGAHFTLTRCLPSPVSLSTCSLNQRKFKVFHNESYSIGKPQYETCLLRKTRKHPQKEAGRGAREGVFCTLQVQFNNLK